MYYYVVTKKSVQCRVLSSPVMGMIAEATFWRQVNADRTMNNEMFADSRVPA